MKLLNNKNQPIQIELSCEDAMRIKEILGQFSDKTLKEHVGVGYVGDHLKASDGLYDLIKGYYE